jgi:DNA-binding transcriptional ArsR family regulator
MLEKLFGSRTRVKLLRLFLLHPQKEYFVREISRVVDEQINSVRRELGNLERIGILASEEKDKKKYYRAVEDFILFGELRALILKSRFTIEKEFIQSVRALGSVLYFVLTGYFVNERDAKVDMMIVGNVNRTKLNSIIEKFHSFFVTPIRYTVMTKDEFHYRRDVTDKFLYEILNGKKIVVVDKTRDA